MSDAALAAKAQTKSGPRMLVIRTVLTLVFAAAVIPFAPRIARAFAYYGFHPHGPDQAIWAGLAPQIKIHIAAAVLAFAIGFILMLRPKGVGLHKTMGWMWVAAMGATAVSSFFITGLNGDAFSLIHLLSGWTVVALPMAVYAIRRRDVMLHRRFMTGLFFGGMVIAGLLAFLPGRVMYMMFFG